MQVKPNDTQMVYERLKYLKWQNYDKYCMFAIRFNEKFNKLSMEYYVQAFRDIFDIRTSIISYNKDIVCILKFLEGQTVMPESIEKLNIFLNKHSNCAGISQYFKNISQLYKYYSQTTAAISLGKKFDDKNSRSFFYDDISIMHMLDICSTKREIIDFCHPYVKILLAHDEKFDTEYLRTFYAFIMNGRKLKSAADELYIHRNTMDYRMVKISEILGTQKYDSDTIVHLEISFMIMRFLSKLQ